MDVRGPRDAKQESLDPRDLEISHLKREVAAVRGREGSARLEAQDARKHFADLTSKSKRFDHSTPATDGERQQQRRRLAAQYDLSRVLAEARDLDEAVPKIYEVLGERLGWQAGALWKVEENPDGSRVLRRAGFWRSGGSPPGALEAASEETVFRRGEGLPGRAWERCEPVWVEDLFFDDNMPRKDAAAEDGLRGALAFPIVDGGFVGVFELFRREVLPPDEDLMRTAGLVGSHLSQFLERRHAEDEGDLALIRERAAHERTAGILESINDAFFTLDGERRFVYVTSKAEELLGTTRGELLGQKICEMYPDALGSKSYRATEEALKNGKTAEFETVSPVLGVWISVRVYPSADGVSVLFHSIEERKRAEEVSAWSARLRALQADVGTEFTRGSDMGAILQRCAESMVEHLEVAFARIWLLDEGDKALDLRASAGMYTHLDGPHGRIGLGDHKIGRIAQERRPHLTNEVQDDLRLQDNEWARREGIVSFAGYPLIAEGRLVGVAAVFARRELAEETLEAMASVSDAMAQGIVREQAEEALRRSEERLQQAIAIETVGVIFFEPNGSVTQSNDAFLRMSGYDREDLEAGLVRWDRMTPPEYMPQSLRAVEDFVTLGRTVPYEKEYIRKDGSRWWALFAATRLDGGEGAEFVVDITEAKRAEEALRQSEERFRAISDLVPDLLWSNDPSGATGWYNQRWFEYTGQSLVEDEAYDWLYAVHPDDREASLRAFLDSIDSGEPLWLEHRIRGRDGAYRWFLLRSRPVYDDEGRIVRWFGAATDVHEQRAALEALRESEERYRSLAEATPSIVWTADRNGAVVEEIPAWEEFTGQTYPEYQGFGWLHALHPEDRPPDSLWEEMAASEPETMEEEYRLRRRDGEYRHIVLRGVPIVGEAGETREWVGTVFDVEDHRRSEEEREGLRRAAERERARLEMIMQQMPGGVFIADASGHFVLANDGGRRIYGREIGSVEECARHSRSYPDGEEIPPEGWPLARALRGEAISGTEYCVVSPDGTRRAIRANAAPVFDEEGNVVAAVKAFEDVTGRKEAEEERDRSHSREREARDAAEGAERRLAFYARAREERQIISRELHDRVAHSIAVVRQNLELYEVLRDRNPKAAAAKMELAKEEAKASLKSTRDLSMMLRRSEVEDGMANALAGLKGTTVPMGVRYGSTVTGDEGLVPPHMGNQIFLVLREAVRNAVNHSDCERVEVCLEITREGVIGTVEDDGRGFEPDGTHAGGGLRSMEERASLVGGTFGLRSVPNEGTRVEVSVPLSGPSAR